jgi:hypothetical protein
MRKFLTTLATSLLMLATPALAADSWIDSLNGRTPTVGDKWPLPVQEALSWDTNVLNIVAMAACSTGDTRLRGNTAVGYFYLDDGGSFTDDTTDANDAGANDVNPWPATPAVNDAVYWGSASNKFDFVRMNIGTQGSTVMTVVWEYYDTSGNWTSLTTFREDVTDYDETVGIHDVGFVPPNDWATTTVNSATGYWIRQRVTAYTSHTTDALITQVWIGDVTSHPARRLIIRAWPDETEILVCNAGSGGANNADNVGFPFDYGVGVLTVEVKGNAGDVYCCCLGGTCDVAVILLTDGS